MWRSGEGDVKLGTPSILVTHDFQVTTSRGVPPRHIRNINVSIPTNSHRFNGTIMILKAFQG